MKYRLCLFFALAAMATAQETPAKPEPAEKPARTAKPQKPLAKKPESSTKSEKVEKAEPEKVEKPAAKPASSPAEAIVTASPAAAETPRVATPTTASTDIPAQVAGIFFGLLQKGQIDPAYEGLTKGSKIAERPEELRTLKTKTKEAVDVFGPVQAYELIETKNVGTHLLRRTYLSLNKEFPLRWRFYFYLSDNLWRLIDLRVDDRVTGMLDETDDVKSAAEPK